MTAEEQPERFTTYTPDKRSNGFGRGYSIFVKILKFTLPLVALSIMAIVVIRLSKEPQQPIQKSQSVQNQTITPIKKETPEKTTPGQIELIKAKYEGVDIENRAYTITADKAIRAMNKPDTVLFEKPLADIVMKDNAWMALKAEKGSFNHATSYLTLENNVSIFHDAGYEMHLQSIELDLKEKIAFTKDPVKAQSSMGTIEAANMSIKKQGHLIIFGGPVKLTLFNLF